MNGTAKKVIATMATHLSRLQGAQEVIRRISPQVDELHVYLNDYDYPIEKFKTGNTQFYFHPHGDIADNGKFILDPKKYPQSHFATIDDDLLYPPDYISRLQAEMKRTNDNFVLSYHGAILHNSISSYYNDRTTFSHELFIRNDIAVHVVGTGCMMFSTDKISYEPEYFINSPKFMSDILFSAVAMENGVRRYVLAHERKFLPRNKIEAAKDSIALRFHRNDIHMTETIKKFEWWK